MRIPVAIPLLVASCASSTLVPVAPRHPLPVYRGPSVTLFDDGIDTQPPSAGFEPGASPADSERLRERTQLGDCVARVRVVTISSTESKGGASWQIGLHTLETLAGDSPLGTDWTLRVDERGEAAGVLRGLGPHLIDRPFIAFLRRFAGAQGGSESELHFHLAAEDQDQLGAVRVAVLLAQVK